MVLFVDDVNMTQKEYYGARPPIELLQMWHDHREWFNRKELVRFEVIEIIMASAMGSPGGGRTFITERLKRHYNIQCYTVFQEESIRTSSNLGNRNNSLGNQTTGLSNPLHGLGQKNHVRGRHVVPGKRRMSHAAMS